MTTMKELETLYNEIQKLKHDIAKYEERESVQDYLAISDKLTQSESMLKQLTTEAAASVEVVDWKPDRLSKGKKDIYTEGSFSILRSKRTIRKIIPKKFAENYPLELSVLINEGQINIPIGIVEPVIGKNKTNDICEANVSYSYELVSRELPKAINLETPEELKSKTKKTAKKKQKVTQ